MLMPLNVFLLLLTAPVNYAAIVASLITDPTTNVTAIGRLSCITESCHGMKSPRLRAARLASVSIVLSIRTDPVVGGSFRGAWNLHDWSGAQQRGT
jgi:hypothetical protein